MRRKRVYEAGGSLYIAHSVAGVCNDHGYRSNEVRRCPDDELVELRSDGDGPIRTLNMLEVAQLYPVGHFIPEGP